MEELKELESQISWLEEDIANEKDLAYKSWMEQILENLRYLREEIINESN